MSKTFDTSQIINQIKSFKGFKNRIINGAFQVKQRGGGGIVNKQDFILDRFQSQTAGSIITAKDLIVAPDSVPIVDNVDPLGDGSGITLWKLDGDATDAGGNYNGAWSGTEQYDIGVFGQGAKFDGNNAIKVGTANDIIPSNTSFTISLWVKINEFVKTYDRIIGAEWHNGGFMISKGYDGDNFSVLVGGNDVDANFRNNYSKIDLKTTLKNNFYNIIFGVNKNNNKMFAYLNGNLVDEITFSKWGYADNSVPLWIGADAQENTTDPELFIDGFIDQVRVFNRALTEEEIQKLYLEESKVIKKPHSITLKTGNKPSDYSAQTIKHLVYRFEGQHLYDLISEGKKATLSFKMTAKKAGKYSIALINKTTSNYETLLQTFDYSGNQDELVSVTFDLSQFQNEVRNDENLGCELVVCGYTEKDEFVGSIGRNNGEKICASGCVAIDDNDSISITGLQLEEGEYATTFEVVPYDVELMRCMRYYEKGSYKFRNFTTDTGQYLDKTVQFKVNKAALPTILVQWNSNSYITYEGNNVQIHLDSFKPGTFKSTGASNSSYYYFSWEADAEL